MQQWDGVTVFLLVKYQASGFILNNLQGFTGGQGSISQKSLAVVHPFFICSMHTQTHSVQITFKVDILCLKYFIPASLFFVCVVLKFSLLWS